MLYIASLDACNMLNMKKMDVSCSYNTELWKCCVYFDHHCIMLHGCNTTKMISRVHSINQSNEIPTLICYQNYYPLARIFIFAKSDEYNIFLNYFFMHIDKYTYFFETLTLRSCCGRYKHRTRQTLLPNGSKKVQQYIATEKRLKISLLSSPQAFCLVLHRCNSMQQRVN